MKLVAFITIAAIMLGATPTCAGELSPDHLRQRIKDAGMAPWNGRQISLDEPLRGQNRERVALRQFLGKPLLAYNYGEW